MRLTALVLIVALLSPTVALAVDGKKATYIGGTVAAFAGAEDPIEGRLNLDTADVMVLVAETKRFRDQQVRIPYKNITDLEYGQKAGRRVAVAIMVSPLALFSKKRNHYLTVGYTDDAGQAQVAVLELGKDIVRTTLAIVETRSGKPIEYQDDEARKAGRGN